MENKTSQCLETRKHVAYEVMGGYGLKITKNFYQPGDHRLMRLFVFSFFLPQFFAAITVSMLNNLCSGTAV